MGLIQENEKLVNAAADAFELVGMTFSYPDEGLAEALQNGAYESDALAILADLDACEQDVQDARSALASLHSDAGPALSDDASVGLLDDLRKGHSLLYLAPGSEVPVWSYEAPFRYVAADRQGAPSLFRSPTTLDVEKRMRESGFAPSNRNEPVDSMALECFYVSRLCRESCEALAQGNCTQAVEHLGQAHSFCEDHLFAWLPDFMDATTRHSKTLSFGTEYVALASACRVIALSARRAIGESLNACGNMHTCVTDGRASS